MRLFSNAHEEKNTPATLHKKKFFIKDFFNKCDQIRSFLQICSHLPNRSLTLFKMGRGPKSPPPYQVSHLTSTNRNWPRKLSDFYHFCHTGVKCQGHAYCQPLTIKLEPRTPFKKLFFWSKPYKIEVRNARVTELWSHHQIYNIVWVTWWNKITEIIFSTSNNSESPRGIRQKESWWTKRGPYQCEPPLRIVYNFFQMTMLFVAYVGLF